MILLYRGQSSLINMHLAKIIFQTVHSKQFFGNFTFFWQKIYLLQLLFYVWLNFFIGFSNVLEIGGVFFDGKHFSKIPIGHSMYALGLLQMLKLFRLVKFIQFNRRFMKLNLIFFQNRYRHKVFLRHNASADVRGLTLRQLFGGGKLLVRDIHPN